MDQWGKLDSAASEQGPMASLCKHGDGSSGYIKKASCSLTVCVTVDFSKNILHHGVVCKFLNIKHIYTLRCQLMKRWLIRDRPVLWSETNATIDVRTHRSTYGARRQDGSSDWL